MTNKELHAEVRKSRPELTQMEIARIGRTLQNLPRRKDPSLFHKMSVAIPIAASIALIMIFTAPTVVKAVSEFIGRVFEQKAKQFEEYQMLPEEERISQMAARFDESGYTNQYEGATAEFFGNTVVLKSASVGPDLNADDPSSTAGYVYAHLTYSELPAFDPNWMEFTLDLDGRIYPQETASGLPDPDTRVTNPEQWTVVGESWDSNTIYVDDELMTLLQFPIDDWRLTGKTAMVLKGALDGQAFTIAFTLDSEAGRAANRDWATEVVLGEESAKWAEETRAKLENFAAVAVPVGVKTKLLDNEYIIEEMAVTEDERFHFVLRVPDTEETHPVYAAHRHCFISVDVDGRPLLSTSSDEESLDEGVFTGVYNGRVDAPLDELSEESIICVKFSNTDPAHQADDWGDGDGTVYGNVAFKFNPKTKAVTLPKDAEEMAEWYRIGAPEESE